MHRTFLYLFVASALVAMPAASHAAPREKTPAARRVVNRIVAIVDREVITLHKFERRTAPVIAKLPQPKSKKPGVQRAYEVKVTQQRKAVLEEMIDAELLVAQAERLHVEVNPTMIDAALAEVATKNSLTEPQVLEAAAAMDGAAESCAVTWPSQYYRFKSPTVTGQSYSHL